jgi:hypothetical protein
MSSAPVCARSLGTAIVVEDIAEDTTREVAFRTWTFGDNDQSQRRQWRDLAPALTAL